LGNEKKSTSIEMKKVYEILLRLRELAESKEEAKEVCRLRLVSLGMSHFEIVDVKESKGGAKQK
jgi:hypothetical protein